MGIVLGAANQIGPFFKVAMRINCLENGDISSSTSKCNLVSCITYLTFISYYFINIFMQDSPGQF